MVKKCQNFLETLFDRRLGSDLEAALLALSAKKVSKNVKDLLKLVNTLTPDVNGGAITIPRYVWAEVLLLPQADVFWRSALTMVLSKYTVQSEPTETDCAKVATVYKETLNSLTLQYKMEGAWNVRPLLAGDEVLRLLAPGTDRRVMSYLMDEQKRWLLQHWEPDATKRGELKRALSQHLKKIADEFVFQSRRSPY